MTESAARSGEMGHFVRQFLVQTDEVAIQAGNGKPPQFRVYSVTKCTYCLALVVEEDGPGHARFHAEQLYSRYWGPQW